MKVDSYPVYQPTYSVSEDNCPICIEKLEGTECEENKTLKCNHTFHKKCIDSWLFINNTCPVCRAKVEGKFISNQSESIVINIHNHIHNHTYNRNVIPSNQFDPRDVKSTIFFGIFMILLTVIGLLSMIFMLRFDEMNNFIGKFKINNTTSDKYDTDSIYIPISGMIVSYIILTGTIFMSCFSLRKPFKINLCALTFIIIILTYMITRIDIVLYKIKHTEVILNTKADDIHNFMVLQWVLMGFLVVKGLVNVIGLIC